MFVAHGVHRGLAAGSGAGAGPHLLTQDSQAGYDRSAGLQSSRKVPPTETLACNARARFPAQDLSRANVRSTQTWPNCQHSSAGLFRSNTAHVQAGHEPRVWLAGTPDRTRTCAPGSGGRCSIQLSYGGFAVILSGPFRHCKAKPAPGTTLCPAARLFVQPIERYTRPRWAAHPTHAGRRLPSMHDTLDRQ